MTGGAGGGGYMHSGQNPDIDSSMTDEQKRKKTPHAFLGTMAFDVTDINDVSCEIAAYSPPENANMEQYPSYTHLPVMIYIGKRI